MAKTVLVVEDNEENMKLFLDLLQSQGYKTLHSYDGSDAIQLARDHQPDLIVMDIQLPGVSGFEHTMTLKADKSLKHIPVLAVTAFRDTWTLEKMLGAGCNSYLNKPIRANSFLEVVDNLISGTPPYKDDQPVMTDGMPTATPQES